jgi:hypothetical protein
MPAATRDRPSADTRYVKPLCVLVTAPVDGSTTNQKVERRPPPQPISQSGFGFRSPAVCDAQRDDLEWAQAQFCLRVSDVDQGGRFVEGALDRTRPDQRIVLK